MRICILGAGGVFGQNFADYSMQQGHQVMGIGRSPRKADCFTLGIEFPYHPYHLTYELEYVLDEIHEFSPDVIVNFAAQGEGAASWGMDNWRFYETNCVGLVRLLSQVREIRFIQIGSSEVYGSVDKPVSEGSPTYPSTPYAASKLAFDLHLVAMHKTLGLPINIIRPSNCYAPGQQLHRIIPKALISGLTGRRLPLHGGGYAKKSYLHATDLSRAILKVIEGPVGEIYNVGPQDPTFIKDVVALCLNKLNVRWVDIVEGSPERTGQDSCYWLDSSKIKALSWKQEIGWEEGLGDMVRWMRRYPELQHLSTEFRMRA